MTTTQKQLQHQVRARVLTGAGWLEGTFHLAPLHGFAQYLSKHAWYPMTEVVLAKVGTLPFFQLARAETLLVVLPAGTSPHPTTGTGALKAQAASFVLAPAFVDGTVQLAEQLRLSDFIDHSAGFIHVQAASVRVWADPGAESFADVLLNPLRLVGVIEAQSVPTEAIE